MPSLLKIFKLLYKSSKKFNTLHLNVSLHFLLLFLQYPLYRKNFNFLFTCVCSIDFYIVIIATLNFWISFIFCSSSSGPYTKSDSRRENESFLMEGKRWESPLKLWTFTIKIASYCKILKPKSNFVLYLI